MFLTDAQASGTTYIETGDRATSGSQTWNRFEINGGPALVVIGDKIYRPTVADIHSDGDVWIFFTRVTRRGTLYKSGEGIWETLRGLERTGRLAEVTGDLRKALADFKEDRIEQELRGIVASATKITFPDTLRWHAVNELRAQILDQGNRLLHATPWNQGKAIGVMRLRYNDFLAATSRPRAMADVRANLHKIAVEEAASQS